MREEYIKDSFQVDGVKVIDLGVEYVFKAKNENGEEIEHHLSKKEKFPIDDKGAWVDLAEALRACVNFPNLTTKEAVEALRKMPKEKK